MESHIINSVVEKSNIEMLEYSRIMKTQMVVEKDTFIFKNKEIVGRRGNLYPSL